MRKVGYALAAAFVLTGSAAAMYAVQRAARSESHAAQPAVTHASPAAPAAAPAVEAPAAAPASPEPAAPAAAPAISGTAPALRGGASAEPHAPARAATQPRRSGGAEDLLQRANRLRGDGDYRGAERTYLSAVALAPHGPVAYAARVAAAGLRLDHWGDARGALRLYTEALREQPAGALTPEIHEGMAHADRALGRVRDERQALQALLSEQPSGPAAERARARLQALDANR
jgi:hypothetical protein